MRWKTIWSIFGRNIIFGVPYPKCENPVLITKIPPSVCSSVTRLYFLNRDADDVLTILLKITIKGGFNCDFLAVFIAVIVRNGTWAVFLYHHHLDIKIAILLDHMAAYCVSEEEATRHNHQTLTSIDNV